MNTRRQFPFHRHEDEAQYETPVTLVTEYSERLGLRHVAAFLIDEEGRKVPGSWHGGLYDAHERRLPENRIRGRVAELMKWMDAKEAAHGPDVKPLRIRAARGALSEPWRTDEGLHLKWRLLTYEWAKELYDIATYYEHPADIPVVGGRRAKASGEGIYY